MNALEGIEARIGEDTARVLRSCVALVGSDAQFPGSADEICARIGVWAAQARECVCFGGRDHVTAQRVIEVCAMALGAPISEVTRTGKGNRSSLAAAAGTMAARILRYRLGRSCEEVAEGLGVTQSAVWKRLAASRAAETQTSENGAASVMLEHQVAIRLGIVDTAEQIDLRRIHRWILDPLEVQIMLTSGSRDEGRPAVCEVKVDIGGDYKGVRELGYGPQPIMAACADAVQFAEGILTDAIRDTFRRIPV